jgi:hypothetical protein
MDLRPLLQYFIIQNSVFIIRYYYLGFMWITVLPLVWCFSVATPTSIGICFLFFASYYSLSIVFFFFFDTFCIAHGCWSGDATTGRQ